MTVKGWAEHNSKNNNKKTKKTKKKTKHTEKPKERIEEDAIGPVADTDLQIKGGGGRSSKPWDKGGGGWSQTNFFSALRALVSSKNKGAPGPAPGSATKNVRFSFRSSGRTKSFQKASLGEMRFSVTNFDHTKRVSVDSWKTRTYGLRISKWKAGVRSFLIRNHLFPLDEIKPSPVKEKTEIFVPHNKDAQ